MKKFWKESSLRKVMYEMVDPLVVNLKLNQETVTKALDEMDDLRK